MRTASEFAQDVSIIGMKHVFNRNLSTSRRTVWAALIVTAIGLSGYLIVNRVQYFLDNPVTVRVELHNENKIQFPAVTVCSDSFLGRHWFLEQNLTQKEEDYKNFLTAVLKPKNAACLEEPECAQMMKKMKVPLSPVEYEQVLQAMVNKLVPLCTFQNRECRTKQVPVLTNKGVCLVLGSADEGGLHSKGIGIIHGLQIAAAAVEDDVLVSDETRGFRIKLHDPHQKEYNMRASPILVPADHHVYIAMTAKVNMFLDRAESPCIADRSYSMLKCEELCAWKYVKQRCNCTIAGPAENLTTYDSPCLHAFGYLCNLNNMRDFHSFVRDKRSTCGCLPQCIVTSHNVVVSSAQSDPAFTLYMAQLQGYSIDSTDVDRVRASFISIYFDSTSVEHITQQYSFSFWALLAEIGGAMGLFVGAALFTLVEVIDFIINKVLEKQKVMSQIK